MALNPADFFVSETMGFVLENPLSTLPVYFEPWNRMAKEMPELVTTSSMRKEINKLPLLDWTQLEGHRQKRLAHLQLTIIAAGYVWQNGDKGASKSLPACIAVPLYRLSEDLGLPPIIGHAGFALSNYAVIDPGKPITMENLRVLYYLPGGEECAWFFLIGVTVELTFAKSIKSIVAAVQGVDSGDETLVTSSLCDITQVVKDMKKAFSRTHEGLTTNTFFNKMRPFVGGWGGENNPLPDGLIYEGVSDQPIHAIGASAAQSSTIQVLDALMGVEHTADKKAFLMKMREYMPPAHHRFIEAIENQPKSLRSFVTNHTSQELHEAYNTLIAAMVDFRTYHIQVVAKYVVQASSKANQKEGKKFESLDKKGTGGTSLMPFLKEIREDTKKQRTDTMISADGKV